MGQLIVPTNLHFCVLDGKLPVYSLSFLRAKQHPSELRKMETNVDRDFTE